MSASVPAHPPVASGTAGAYAPSGPLDAFDGRHPAWALRTKRGLDVAGAVVGLVLLAPVLLVLAAVIAIADGRPVLFTQERVGQDGRRFRLWKFRTMIRDADARFDEVAALSETAGGTFKLTHDPRITRLGRVLRRTSLDELPQLWNVLLGEMSLVGPRPAPAREVICYLEWHRRRLTMKPGMTGLWQVASRFDEHIDQRVALDLAYIEGWSILADLLILARTLPAVLRCTGR